MGVFKRGGKPGKHGVAPAVSNCGRYRNSFGFKYEPVPKRDGYSYVVLQASSSSKKTVALHRIVHILFNDPSLDKYCPGATVDHIDRRRSNNVKNNLRWASKSEQSKNRHAHRCNTGHRVCISDSSGNTLEFSNFVDAAAHIGVHSSQLSRGCNFNGWTVERVDPDLDGEEWRTAPHDPSLKVSSLGRIMSTKSDKHFPKPAQSGYVQTHGQQLHAIVLAAFGYPKPSPLHTPDHIDRDRSNNALSNLRWFTPEQQARNRSDSRATQQRPIEGRCVGDNAWVWYADSRAARDATGVEVLRISNVCNPGARTKTAPGNGGLRYEFRNASDESQKDLPNEVWKSIDIADWMELGKYGHI